MEQVSFLQDDNKIKIANQMKRAATKGIVPGAIIVIDDNYSNPHAIESIYVGSGVNLEMRLRDKASVIPWSCQSDRIKVIGYYTEIDIFKNGEV